MSSANCKAITKSGEKCKLKANSSGYCHIHDPEKIAEYEAKQHLPEMFAVEVSAKTFSQRRGLKPISEIIQIDSMNDDLRNSLWNVLSTNFFLQYSKFVQVGIVTHIDVFIKFLWDKYFKYPLDNLPTRPRESVNWLLKYFQNCQWYEVYDFLEITINYFQSPKLVENINFVLERELAGYRFVGGVFTDITNEQEIEMLEQAVDDKNFPAVSTHLKRSLALMSDKENPDYRNSIKESISAVESLAKAITAKPKATLADALKVLEVSHNLHPALKNSFLILYGYTSDEGGIRHAMLSEPDLTIADAKFFLLSCTSFINYLKSKI
ncbi:AbiJ-NTD4 domain-containing protein [uncultured Nostoc sp.]|uniref:AbiJ-NTD4 domain-containing protein n=1 Tax=uncultured Nostoc sp. TaxID=340711 RepID=UPI0035CBF8F8